MPQPIPIKPGNAGEAQTAIAPPWTAAAPASHIGARDEQQDARGLFFDAAQGTLLMVVSDGVGGSRSGGEASALVIKSAADQWGYQKGKLPDPRRNLLAMCEAAHQRICELAAAGEKRAPAATVVALYLQGNQAHWVHSGDSRLYHFRGGELVFRTRDHSVVQILVEQGDLEESEMGSHPDQGRLLQSLGTKDYREPAYGTAETGPEDSFLLCTDGFWERTPVREMIQVLGGESRGLAQRLGQAIERAVAANGAEGDNVTAVGVMPSAGLERAPWYKRWVVAAALVGFGILTLVAALFLLPKLSGLSASSDRSQGSLADVGQVFPSAHPSPERPEPGPVAFRNDYGEFYPAFVHGGTIYVAAHEFTVQAWEEARAAGAPVGDAEAEERSMRPKTNVSPEEVVQFVHWLNENRKDGRRFDDRFWYYSLPTAAEWAALAGGPHGKWKHPWNQDTPDCPPGFGNWQPQGSGSLKEVGSSTNDRMPQWPVRDIVGNAAEIVRLPEGQGRRFARLGSAFNTPAEESGRWHHDLEHLSGAVSKLPPSMLLDDASRSEEVGFRLILVDQPPSLPTPAPARKETTPPVAQKPPAAEPAKDQADTDKKSLPQGSPDADAHVKAP